MTFDLPEGDPVFGSLTRSDLEKVAPPTPADAALV